MSNLITSALIFFLVPMLSQAQFGKPLIDTTPTFLGASKVGYEFTRFSCFEGTEIPGITLYTAGELKTRMYVDSHSSDPNLEENEVQIRFMIHANKTANSSFWKGKLKPQFQNDKRCRSPYLSSYELGGNVTLFKKYRVKNVKVALEQLQTVKTAEDFYTLEKFNRAKTPWGYTWGYLSTDDVKMQDILNSKDVESFEKAVLSVSQQLNEIYEHKDVSELPLSRAYLIRYELSEP